MARKTKKMKTSIQLPVLNGTGKGDSNSPAAITANPQLDAILASVLRVFAARGRAIREARDKKTEASETTPET